MLTIKARKLFLHFTSWIKSWSLDLANRSLAICIFVGAIACFVLLAQVPIVSEFLYDQDIRLQDQFFHWRGQLSKILGYRCLSAKDIVIVDIDHDSLERVRSYPRGSGHLFARLIKELHKAQARIIALDVSFEGMTAGINDIDSAATTQPLSKKTGSNQSFTKNSEQDFVQELTHSHNIVLATNVQHIKGIFADQNQVMVQVPAGPLVNALPDGAGSLGNTELNPDQDGLIRSARLTFGGYQPLGALVSSFSLRIAEKDWKNMAFLEAGNKVLLYERRYPTSFRINFVGPTGSFLVVPLWRALNWHDDSKPLADNSLGEHAGSVFRNKIVLVGYFSNPASEIPSPRAVSYVPSWPADNYWTPASDMDKPMSGVEVQANIVANVLTGRYLSIPEWWEHVLILLFIALLVARIFSGLHGRPFSMLAAVLLLGFVWLIDAFLCFVYLECLVPVMVPIFGVALPACFLVIIDQNRFAFQERRRHTRLFRNLAPELLAEEIDNHELGELGLEGKDATVTTLVCQLDNFSIVTDRVSPEVVIQLVNQCLKEMIASVYEHNGIVNRIFTNGVMALWGAPISMHEISQVRLAASCFIDIEKRIGQLSRDWQLEHILNKQEIIECGFGINTGDAICGQIGTETHSEYGAIGSSVDLTMWFQSMAKSYGVRCVIGERTAQLLSNRFEIRQLDSVKSLQRNECVYQLICQKGKLPGAMEEVTAIYKQGLAAMGENNFQEAERLFTTTLRMVPDDRPSLLMLNRCQIALANDSKQGGVTPIVNVE